MATLKGAYQRFVTSIIRLWKREESEDSDITQEATNSSSLELLADDNSLTKKETNSVLESPPEPYFSAQGQPSHSAPDLLIEEVPDNNKDSPKTLKKKTSNLKRGLSFLKLSQSHSANDLKQSEDKYYIERRPRNYTSPVLARKLSNTNLLRPPSTFTLYERHPRLRREGSSPRLLRDLSPVQRGRSNSNLLKDQPPVVLRRNLGTSDLLRDPPRVNLRRELSISNLFLSTPRVRPQRKARPKSVSDALIPERPREKHSPKKSPTELKPSSRVPRKTVSKTQSDPQPGLDPGPTSRIRTLTIASRFSKFASKKIDGTLRRRTKTDAKFKRKIMEDIDIGKDKTMPGEVFLGRLRDYNTYYDERPALQFKWKQDKNGNLLVDGMLNIYWGLKRSIRLQMADGGVKIRPQSQLADAQADAVRKFDVLTTGEPINEENVNIVHKNETLSGTILRNKTGRPKTIGETPTSNGDVTISIENGILGETRHRSYDRRRMALKLKNGGQKVHINTEDSDGLLRQRSVILRKRLTNKSGKKRFSINGHAYNYQTSVFTPDYASVTNVRITSKTGCDDVIKHLLNKFRVENSFDEFSLYVVKKTGERRELTRSEFPLITRVLSGPNEQFCKIFIMDRNMHQDISSDVAQYIKLDLNILTMVVKKFTEEEERETENMKERYAMYRKMLEKRIAEVSAQT